MNAPTSTHSTRSVAPAGTETPTLQSRLREGLPPQPTVVALLESRAGSGGVVPDWLAAARKRAAGWASQRGWPSRKDEDWRYTPLSALIAAAFQGPEVPAGDAGSQPGSQSSSQSSFRHGSRPSIEPPAVGLPAVGSPVARRSPVARMTFVNGTFAAELSSLGDLPGGVSVTSLGFELAGGAGDLEAFFSPRSGEFAHAFEAVNAAVASDGAVIRVDADTEVDGLIELQFYSDGRGATHVCQPRSIVVVGPRSRVSIVETYGGSAGVAATRPLGGWTNAVTQVVVGAHAQVDYYRVQDETDTSFHLGLLDVAAHGGSRFSALSVALGARVGRHEVRVRLEGEGAEVSLNGLYLPGGDRHHDNPVLVVHSAPNCTSRQLYKGIASERGHGVFNGHLVVLPGADGADASQTNKNLLLSDHAEIDTRPRLQILTDDVKCSHGAAVGALDPDAVFYLRSRGVPLEQAKSILTAGFAAEILDTVPHEALRAHLDSLVSSRLAQ